MLFNSLHFALFFPVATALFFGLPQRWRVAWLLISSCAFYMAFIPAYISILFVTIFIDYFAAIYIDRAVGANKRLGLWISIVSTCAVLFVFKYLGLFTSTVNAVGTVLGLRAAMPVLTIILPIGLSFHTFQSLSYVIEVYRGKQLPERNLVVYATYVMFFPQLVAGPIERPQNLLHQFRNHVTFEYERVAAGLKRMAWGFFKKLVVADRLALYVNDVYAAPQQCNGLQLTIATFFFAYQIYCDFSGYSDIAIGAAQILGFRLMENFNSPYHSASVSEFWRRWHISLSTWFKDYVYLPLGGSRAPARRHTLNLMITFAISGLWHGANWTYICWGLLNGMYLVLGSTTARRRDELFAAIGLRRDTGARKVIMRASTFAAICAAWVMFRSQSLSDAGYIVTHLTSHWDFSMMKTPHFLARQFPVAFAGIVIVELGTVLPAQWRVPAFKLTSPIAVRWAVYASFVLLVLLFGIYRNTQFIYFQF